MGCFPPSSHPGGYNTTPKQKRTRRALQSQALHILVQLGSQQLRETSHQAYLTDEETEAQWGSQLLPMWLEGKGTRIHAQFLPFL